MQTRTPPARFAPFQEGGGTIQASRVPPTMIVSRARNAAGRVYWKLGEFLSRFEARRSPPARPN